MDLDAETRAAGLKCRNCGSTNFETPEAGRGAVCRECGVESQDYLNTAFEDWGEESQLYQGGNKSKVLRRTTYVAADRKRRKGRKKKESAALSFAARLAATEKVVAAVATALVRDCGVDAAAERAVAAAWTAYAARARGRGRGRERRRAGAGARRRGTTRARRGGQRQEEGGRRRAPPAQAPAGAAAAAAAAGAGRPRRRRVRERRHGGRAAPRVRRVSTGSNTRLGLRPEPLVLARRAAVPVGVAGRPGRGVARGARAAGGAQLLAAPRAGPGRDRLRRGAALFSVPRRGVAPDGPGGGLRAARGRGRRRRPVPALRRGAGGRLLRLAAHAAPELRVTEPRALAAVCLALLRYADGFVVGPGAEGTFPVLPWSQADAATHPRRADDAAAYAAFVSARERRPRGDRTADAAGEAALEAYADALDRRAAQLDAGPPLARPRRDRPLAPPVVVTRGGVGADAGALLTLGAERLQCPPGVFRAVMDDVRDAVDAAIFADDRSDSEHAARLDDDAREVVLDSSFY